MRRSDDLYGGRHFRRESRRESWPGFSRDIDKTLPSIPEDNGRASDLLARSQTKPKNKVIKNMKAEKVIQPQDK